MYIERSVWYPQATAQVEEESPMQQKLGGSIPFFTKNEQWPRNEDGCLQFVGQCIHPEKNKLLRFFWDPPHINWGSGTNGVVMSLPVSKFAESRYDSAAQIAAEEVGFAYEEIGATEFAIVERWEQGKERLSLCCKRTDCYSWRTNECVLTTDQEEEQEPPEEAVKYECKLGGFLAPLVYKDPSVAAYDVTEPLLLQIVPYTETVLGDLDLVAFYEDGSCGYDFH